MADQVAAAPEAIPSEAWPFPRRFIAAYTSPRALFEHLAARPAWLAPLLVLVVLVAAFVFGLYDSILLPEQLARAADTGRDASVLETFLTGPGRIVIPVIAVGSTVAVLFLYALFVQLVGAFLLGGALHYRQSLSILLHASMVGVLGFALRVPLALIAKSSQVSVGPGMLFPASSAEGFGGHFLSAFLAAFDLFNLWQTALIALGVSVVGRVPQGKANAGIWGLFLAAAVLGALFAGVTGMRGR